jgi:hypothetical protein
MLTKDLTDHDLLGRTPTSDRFATLRHHGTDCSGCERGGGTAARAGLQCERQLERGIRQPLRGSTGRYALLSTCAPSVPSSRRAIPPTSVVGVGLARS